MKRSVILYGFGSAFGGATDIEDIDLLIIHKDCDPAMCQFALRCKRQFVDCIPNSHITILSESEEKYLDFVGSAGAIILGIIQEENFVYDFLEINAVIRQRGVLGATDLGALDKLPVGLAAG